MPETPPAVAPAPPVDFECPRCGKRHPWREMGFEWPDASFALTVSQEEQAKIRQGKNEDTLVIGNRLFFVRGWAPIPVKGGGIFGIGFWIQISKPDFTDLMNRFEHPKYPGRIANQTLAFVPTLGARAEMEFSGKGMRPTIRFTDQDHPFTKAQQMGVSIETVKLWLSEGFHTNEDEAIGKPFDGNLQTYGWAIMDPDQVGNVPMEFKNAPKHGDFLKLIVRFIAADESGNPTPLIAGWWVRLDHMNQKGLWGGTLRNHPRVPATIALGARLWFKPSQVIAIDRQPEDAGPSE